MLARFAQDERGLLLARGDRAQRRLPPSYPGGAFRRESQARARGVRKEERADARPDVDEWLILFCK
jgi:hypothetical protein